MDFFASQLPQELVQEIQIKVELNERLIHFIQYSFQNETLKAKTELMKKDLLVLLQPYHSKKLHYVHLLNLSPSQLEKVVDEQFIEQNYLKKEFWELNYNRNLEPYFELYWDQNPTDFTTLITLVFYNLIL